MDELLNGLCEIARDFCKSVLPALFMWWIPQYLAKRNKLNDKKENKVLVMLKKEWSVYKRLYWIGDQTADYVDFIIMIFIIISIPLFAIIFIYSFYSLVTDLILIDFNNIAFDKGFYILEIYLIRIILAIFLLISAQGLLVANGTYKEKGYILKLILWLGKFIVVLFSLGLIGSMINSLDIASKQIMSPKEDLGITGNNISSSFIFFIRFFFEYVVVFFLANPFDIKTAFKVHNNMSYLKYVSNIPKRFYATKGKEFNFHEIVCYDREKVELNVRTAYSYINSRNYCIIFTIVSKTNPKRKVELSSIVFVEKEKRRDDREKLI